MCVMRERQCVCFSKRSSTHLAHGVKRGRTSHRRKKRGVARKRQKGEAIVREVGSVCEEGSERQ